MAIGAFPLVKLGILLVKQISKPIANGVASRAEKSKAFRNYVCIPIAQLFHLYDVKVRMRVLNLGKVSKEKVPKLNEKKAIETGAQVNKFSFDIRDSKFHMSTSPDYFRWTHEIYYFKSIKLQKIAGQPCILISIF